MMQLQNTTHLHEERSVQDTSRDRELEESGFVPVVVARHDAEVEFSVRNYPPPWLKMAQRAIHIGSVLLVLAMLLFVVVVAEHFEHMDSSTPAHTSR